MEQLEGWCINLNDIQLCSFSKFETKEHEITCGMIE